MAAVDYLLEPVAETDKHLFCVEMTKRMDIQRRKEQFCDVVLEVGCDDDRARLQAHRIVLCAASPFFYHALNSDMKEKKEGVIRLEETSKAVMEDLLEYLYTGHVDINEHNAFDLLAAADFFIIPSLKVLCGKVILQELSLSNCIAAYCLGVKYQCEEVKKGSRDFIHANFVAVAETEDFLNLSKDQIVEWISSDEIIVKGEEEVFEVVKKWITRNKSQEQSLYDLFRHIRCIYVPRGYFLNVILPDPTIRNNRDCSNLAMCVMKMMFSRQEECYFAQAPRNCLKTYEDTIVACGEENIWCYIPSRKNWHRLADMLTVRSFPRPAVSSCQGKLFIIGGNRRSNGHAAERYDPVVNSWIPLRSFQRRIRYCAVATVQGLLYVIGGVDEDDNRLSSVQRYDPDINLWQEMPSLSSPRSIVCAVGDGSRLCAIRGNFDGKFVKTAEAFDPNENAWRRIASTLEKRGGAGGAAVNQKVFVFGGLGNNAPVSNSSEMYDPANNIWSIITSMVVPRGKTSAASIKEKIFVCGENNQELQVYDTATNENISCITLPLVIGLGKLKISALRIPREVLDTCLVLSRA